MQWHIKLSVETCFRTQIQLVQLTFETNSAGNSLFNVISEMSSPWLLPLYYQIIGSVQGRDTKLNAACSTIISLIKKYATSLFLEIEYYSMLAIGVFLFII